MTPETLEEICLLAVDLRLAQISVAMPAEVTAYDAATRTVEVRPLVRRALEAVDGELVTEELPKFPSVPVEFLASDGGAWGVFIPIPVGTTGTLYVLSENDHGWRESGELSDPIDLRRFHPTAARFRPGVFPDKATVPAATNDATVVKGDRVNVGDETATSPAGKADKIESRIATIEAWMVAHSHTAFGGSPTQAYTPFGESLAAEKVFVK